MFDIFRPHPRQTALILLIPVLVAVVYLGAVLRFTLDQNDGNTGALLDDTWIHVRFADHIAQGEGLSYNEGVLTTGATSPLWVLALAGAFAIVNPSIMEQINVAIVMSAIMHIVAVASITGFGWWLTRKAWIGVLAGLFTALTGRFVWMGLSGMEITTFTTFCILAIWSHSDDQRQGRTFGWRTGILTALATLARPEGYLLALLIGFVAIIASPIVRGVRLHQWWSTVRDGWRGVVAYVLLAGAYPLASLLISGYPLPNTFRVKSQLGNEFPELPRTFFWQPNVDYGAFVIVLASVGCLFLLWQSWRSLRTQSTETDSPLIPAVIGLWAPLFVLAVLFMGADRFVVNNSRYVAPSIPFHALFASVGVWIIVRSVVRRVDLPKMGALSPKMALIGAMGGVMLAFVFLSGSDQGADVARGVGQIRQMHVAAGEWFLGVSEPDDVIALNDVGAIVHISDREVLDLEGLVSVDVIEATQNTPDYTCDHDLQLMRLMLENPPAFIGVFPWFYPCMTGWEGLLQPFNVFSITGETVIAGGEMVVYWIQWENFPIQAFIPDDVTRVDARYEQGVTLAGYTLEPREDALAVTLWWHIMDGQPDREYNIFVQMIDSTGEIVGQGDAPPQDGRFPTTLWREGDIIPDTHLIPLDNGDFPADAMGIRVGLYTLDGSRPPLLRTDADGDFTLIPLEVEDDE